MFGASWSSALLGLGIALGVILLITAALFVFAMQDPGRRTQSLRGDALNDEKTRREIEDLRFGWIRTFATASFAVAIAVGGWFSQSQSSLNDQRQRDRQHADETFFKYLDNLGDSNPTKRINAAEFLARVYTFHSGQGGGDVTDADRRQIIVGLVNRFAAEDDLAVQDALRQRLAAIGPDALPTVAEANRRSAFVFARQLGQTAGAEMAYKLRKDPAARDALGNALAIARERMRSDVRDLLDDLTRHTSYSVALSMGHGRPEGFLSFFDDPDRDLSAVYRRNFRNEMVDPVNASADDAARRAKRHDLARAASYVASTGSLLVLLLRTGVATDGADLRGTIIPFSDLSGITLRGAKLSHAVILARLDGARLELSDLSYANMSMAHWQSLSLKGSRIDHAVFDDWELRHARTVGTNDFDADVISFGTGEPLRLATPPAIRRKQRLDECKAAAQPYQLSCPWEEAATVGKPPVPQSQSVPQSRSVPQSQSVPQPRSVR